MSSTIKAKENPTYSIDNRVDLIPLLDDGGSGQSITPLQIEQSNKSEFALSVGVRGEYTDIASAAAFIAAEANVINDRIISGTGVTIDVVSDSQYVTFGGTGVDVFPDANGIIEGRTVWSPDNIYWYEVERVINAQKIKLVVPYFGTTIAGGVVYLGTPKTYTLNLQAGIHNGLGMDISGINFANIVVNAGREVFIEKTDAPSGIAIKPQLSGRLVLNGILSINSAVDGGSQLLQGQERTEVEVYDSKLDHTGVDCIIGTFGKFYAHNSIFGSSQDGITGRQRQGDGRLVFDNCRLYFHVSYVGATLLIRCIWDGKFQLNNCTVYCDNSPDALIGTRSLLFDITNADFDCQCIDTKFFASGFDASEFVFMSALTGTILAGNLDLVRCEFISDFITGIPEIIDNQAWTGGATINFSDCKFNDHIITDTATVLGDQNVTFDIDVSKQYFVTAVAGEGILRPHEGGVQVFPVLSTATTAAGFLSIRLLAYEQNYSRLVTVFEQDATGGYQIILHGSNFNPSLIASGTANQKRIIDWIHDGLKYQINADTGWY